MSDTNWRSRAVCRDRDPELWFPVGTEGAAVTQAAKAIEVCGICPVRRDCLSFVLSGKYVTGVFGGVWFDVATSADLAAARTDVRDLLTQ